MMTKKSTHSTATFANAALLERLKLEGLTELDGLTLSAETQRKIDAILLERLSALNRTAAARRRYYEAS